MKEDKKVKVIFRKYRDGSILALFPEIEFCPGYCSSYMHIGQHSAARYEHCIESTKPAKEEEYKPLLEEILSIGYDLVIRKRK